MTQPGPAISLDEIVTREIPVQWDEAVAIVEELCGILTAGDQLPVPELIDIRISADGTIAMAGRVIGERSARSAGRVLHLLLSSANTPVALRLFVTNATSSDTYASIRDFAAGLAYFGKPVPARAPLIRALYERSVTAGIPSTGDAPRRHVTSSERPSGKPPAPRNHARARWARRVIVASAASLAGAAIWFSISTITVRTTTTSLPTLISDATSAVRTLESEVRTYLGFGPPAIGGTQDASTPKVTRPSGRLMKPHQWQSEPQPISIIPLLPDGNHQAVTALPLGDRVLTIDDPARAETPVEGRDVERIYSSSDSDVRPPVVEFPQMPSAGDDSSTDVMNRMELVISDEGTVEHVRLVAGPNRMTDMMLLSGAKTWRFKPAVKNGKPVRYRTTVSWIAGP